MKVQVFILAKFEVFILAKFDDMSRSSYPISIFFINNTANGDWILY